MYDKKLEIALTAKDITGKAFTTLTGRIDRLTRKVFSLQGAFTAAAAAAGMGYFVKQSLNVADAIGKTADRIGITTDALQQYRHAAELSGIEQSRLDTGLEAFTKRLGEARAGTGAMVTYLRKYDETLLENIRTAGSTEQALTFLFNAMDDMTSASDRAALSAAAFSRTAGVQMVNLVREGTTGLNAMMQEARDLGLVIDESLIRESEKANDALTKVTKVLKTQMTAAFVSVAPAITTIADQMTGWVKANQKLIEQDMGAVLTSLGNAFVTFGSVVGTAATAYGRFMDIFYGPVSGDPKGHFLKGLERQLELATRSYEIMAQQGNVAESAFREAEAHIFKIKQKIDWVKDDIELAKLKPDQGKSTPGQTNGTSGIDDTGDDYTAWVKDYTAKLGTFVDYWDDSWLRMDRRVSIVGDDIKKENAAWTKDYIASLSDIVDYSGDSWLEISKIVKEENQKSISIVDEAYKNMLENIQEAFADTFYDMFSGQLKDFNDFADSMKKVFLRTLSEMASKAAMTNLFPSVAGGGQAGGYLAGTAVGAAIPYVGAAMLGYSVGQMIGGWLGLGKSEHHQRYSSGSGWQATAAYMDNEYKGISNIKHHGGGEEITDVIKDLYKSYVAQANVLANVVGPQGTIAFRPADTVFNFQNADKKLTELAEHWSDTLWTAFDDAFKRMGFSSMDAVIEGINREQDALGNAFQASLTSGSWMSFKSSLAEQIYNTITTDLTQAMIQSKAIQGALMPIYGGISKGMTAATAGGGFDMGIFGQYTTGAVSQFNTLLQPIKPAFDAMASLSQQIKSLLVGSFANGGIVPETGLAMVHKGEHISNGGTVVINADVITTNDVDTWLAERIQRIDTLRVGKKISKVEIATQGLNI